MFKEKLEKLVSDINTTPEELDKKDAINTAKVIVIIK